MVFAKRPDNLRMDEYPDGISLSSDESLDPANITYTRYNQNKLSYMRLVPENITYTVHTQTS